MEPSTQPTVRGTDVLPYLAMLYPQLYLAPGEAGAQQYKPVVTKGAVPETQTLAHFRGNAADLCAAEETPAGAVRVVTLHERADFETFLQIMANRCVPYGVPRTQGASILDGVISWRRIRAHQAEWLASERARGETEPDWPAEFRRFTADKRNYLDALIVLSVGPYSGVDGAAFGFGEAAWREISHDIRKYHECTHFVCRRMFPELKDPIWDELAADAVGIYAALGHYDKRMAEVFLGIEDGAYRGGRLENYVEPGADLDALAARVEAVLGALDAVIRSHSGVGPFELAIALERRKGELWP